MVKEKIKKLVVQAEVVAKRLQRTQLINENLKVLAFNKDICAKWSNTRAGNNLEILRMNLWESMIIHLYALALDDNKHSNNIGSLPKLFSFFQKNVDSSGKEVLNQWHTKLRLDYIKYEVSQNCLSTELSEVEKQEIAKSYKSKMELERAKQFDDLLSRAESLYIDLVKSDLANKISSARSKIIAHSEIIMDGCERRPVIPKDYGLTWGDPSAFLDKTIEIVDPVVVLSTGCSYDFSRTAIKRAIGEFWGVSNLV